jgi:hypothetical protein
MQSIYKEINSLIESISQKELKANPKLKQDIKNLLRSLVGLRASCKKEERGILKYLDEATLISK